MPPGGRVGVGRAARRIALIALVALVGYWSILMMVPGETGATGDLSPEGNVGAVIDRALMGGHLWKPRWDPEGLLSTIPGDRHDPAGAAGWPLAARERARRRASARARIGRGRRRGPRARLVIGLSAQQEPLDQLYAMYTAGLASLLLGACYLMIDMRGWRRAAYPLIVLGTNAIALFVLSGLLTKLSIVWKVTLDDGSVVSWRTWVYASFFAPLASPYNASLLYALRTSGSSTSSCGRCTSGASS